MKNHHPNSSKRPSDEARALCAVIESGARENDSAAAPDSLLAGLTTGPPMGSGRVCARPDPTWLLSPPRGTGRVSARPGVSLWH